MSAFRRVLRIFLASPGDLADERRAAREVVNELTIPARELGISIELLGWEDTLPGAERPQAMINRDLDVAELFVGLLWRRWGQPTGTHSSGFEEEYHRARSRNAETGAPEIWLFFKEIEPAQAQDPGEQLKQVLLFKRQCESEKQMFYKTFANIEGWKSIFRKYLLIHIIRQTHNATNEPAGEGLTPGSSSHLKPSNTPGSISPTLLPLADLITQLANGASPEPHATNSGGLYAVRLYLIGLALLAKSQTSSDLVETHEINTLFRLRAAFEPLPMEMELLGRSVVADQANVKPGWYWFPQREDEQLAAVFHYALSDAEANVRDGALRLLTSARERDDNWFEVLLYCTSLEAQGVEAGNALWAYLEATVAASDRGRLEELRTSNANSDRLARLVLIARADSEPAAVLAEASTRLEPPTERLLLEIKQNLHEIDSSVLVAAFSSRHSTLRAAIAAELDRRNLMSEIRAAAQADSTESIRVAEYRDRLRSATLTGSEPPLLPDALSYDIRKELEVERLRNLPSRQLEQALKWLSPDAAAAYEVIATEHWESFAEYVRRDLSEKFERIRVDTIERMTQELKSAQLAEIEDSAAAEALARTVTATTMAQLSPELDTFIREAFAKAAIAGIERHGTRDDAHLVRPYLTPFLTQDAAIRALARVGDESDVPALIRIAIEGHGERQSAAARLALRLASDPSETLRIYIQSNDDTLVGLALSKMEELQDDSLGETAIGLLNSADASRRRVAAEFLIRILSVGELEVVLDTYMSQANYYYNVVVLFDRALYCRLPNSIDYA